MLCSSTGSALVLRREADLRWATGRSPGSTLGDDVLAFTRGDAFVSVTNFAAAPFALPPEHCAPGERQTCST